MNTKTYVAVLLSWLTLGCTKNAQVEEVNVHPVARAWIANQPTSVSAGVKGAVMTVRFTWRSRKIRIFGAGYWRKGKAIYEEANG
jgi:hypothetical protein